MSESIRFISHAPNLEDVMLWRALGRGAPGYYIDVGAGDPHHGSVTRALYERGWRGINVEPGGAHVRALRIARPFDLTLALAAGAAPGDAVFYEAAGGRSGFDPEQARRLAAAGHKITRRQVEIATLDALCAAHAPAVIDLLRIDVGGFEAEVLAGLDLRRWRPRVLLVRAGGGAAPAWQADLLRAGYAAAYRDGRNHFYVAAEHAELAAAFALPPNGADRFILHEGHPYAFPVDELMQRAASAEASAEIAAGGVRDAREFAEARGRELEQLGQSAARLEERLREGEAALAALRASLSWRLTKPLRLLVGPLRRAGRLAGRVKASLRFRLGTARVKLAAGLRGALGRARRVAARAARAVLVRGVNFVVARPALAFFMRRQIARHPVLTLRLRTLVLRARGRLNPAPEASPAAVEAQDLAPAARQVLAQLRRAIEQARKP